MFCPLLIGKKLSKFPEMERVLPEEVKFLKRCKNCVWSIDGECAVVIIAEKLKGK